MAEIIARHINEGEDETIAYSHHGSIAREIRLEVEERSEYGSALREFGFISGLNGLELRKRF